MKSRIDVGHLLLYGYGVLFIVFLVAPTLIVVIISFGQKAYVQFPPTGFTLHWFEEALRYETFRNAIVNSTVLAVAATVMSLLISIPAVLALVRHSFPMRNAIESALLLPIGLPMLVLGLALLFYLSKVGLAQSFWGLLAGHVVITTPYIVRTVAAVYRSVDRSLEETAMVLGGNGWQTFYYITLPMIKPGVVAGAIFSFLISFDNVPVSIFLVGPDTMTLPVVIMSYLIFSYDPSVAAVSTLQIAIVIGVLFVIERVYGLGRINQGASQ